MMAQHRMLAWVFSGSGPVLLKKLYFCNFSRGGGGGGPDPLSPYFGSAHEQNIALNMLKQLKVYTKYTWQLNFLTM